MYDNEILDVLTFARINHFNPVEKVQLLRKAGCASVIIENRRNIKDVFPECSERVAEGLKDIDDARRRAESEIDYISRNDIKILSFFSEDYPQRLGECEDAPVVLFYKGTTNLNAKRIVSIVGTRHCTVYGQDIIRRFVTDLRQLCPEVLIVSGLAYGVDINAHQQALSNGYDTVAVLAHGLDTIYPSRHRDIANRMLSQGGLLTEYFTFTNADKLNFLRRNRIVAGVSDATIVVESASHGGGLVTARLALEYNREVFAFPGRIGDTYSEGCNNMIRDSKAAMITSATDFVNMMGWEDDVTLTKARKTGIERTLFPDLTPEEQRVADILIKDGDMQINVLSSVIGLPIHQLTSVLFTMEMKGVVRVLAGGVYHIIS